MFSSMWATWEVAGMATVTAGWETMNLRNNWAQLAQSISAAQAGNGRPRTARNRLPPWNGRLMMTAMPRSAASGSSRASASRSAML